MKRAAYSAFVLLAAACSSSARPGISPDFDPSADASADATGGGGDGGAASAGPFTRVAPITCAGGCPTRYFGSDGASIYMTDVFRAFRATAAGGAATDLRPSNASFSIPQGAGVCVTAGHLFLLGGGGDSILGAWDDPYWRGLDLASGAWDKQPSTMSAHEPAVVAAAGACVSAGGQLDLHQDMGTTRFLRFDPSTHAWSALADLPAPVTAAAIAADGARVFVAGGYCYMTAGCPSAGAGSTVSSSAWLIDLAAGAPAWSNAPALPTPRARARAVAFGGRFYVFGGTPQDGSPGPALETISWAPGESAWRGHGFALDPKIGLAVFADADGILALAQGAGGALDVLRWRP
jgi:hypothetical protein